MALKWPIIKSINVTYVYKKQVFHKPVNKQLKSLYLNTLIAKNAVLMPTNL